MPSRPRITTFALLLAAIPTAATSQEPNRTATIHRDAWGVPHVIAETDQGVLFGMAWALAEDDWPLIEENYLHALGRYAELVGEEGVADDWMARALEIVPLSRREYEAASPRMRGLLDAFAAGMNAWLAGRPVSERRVLDRTEPWYPLALIRYKYYQNEFLGYAGLRGAWSERLRRESLLGGADARSTGPRYYEAQFDETGFRPRGSNQWAVSGARTTTGHPFLLINPHQSFVGVQRYAEIHLDSSEGLRFSGLTVFGFLLPYMGHNEALGWAYTDNYADHSDLYAETFDDPADPLRYRYGAGHRRAERWVDTIDVRGAPARVYEFRKTHHGPIVGIDDARRPLAVKMVRYMEGGWFEQWDAMIRARSLEEWRRGLGMLRVPYMNTMYADRDGNIGYVYNSAVPRRLPGVDPGGVLDGSDPRTEWQGVHPLEELPQVWNPETGWLLNTNSTPFTATSGLDLGRDDFPPYMVGPESDNLRAESSRRVLESMTRVTFDDFAAGVWDSRLSEADRVVPLLLDEWQSAKQPDTAERGDLARAIDRLSSWDRVADTASVETTWFVLMWEGEIMARQARQREGRSGGGDVAPWTTALAGALRSLREEWGTTDVAWGRINRHQRPLPGAPVTLDGARASLPVGGAGSHFGSVFSYHSRPPGSAGPRLGTGGNSFVSVIEFGPVPRARSILNYGQSGDPASAHFFDQAELYIERRFKPAWWTREDVEREAARSYIVTGN